MTQESSTPDNFLFDIYEKYIGEPETETDVYLGFGLFFAGVAFAGVALIAFVVAVTLYGYRGSGGYFSIAQVSYSFALLSAPVTMLSIVVLLPVEKKAVYGALGGVIISFIATVGFVVSYPGQWAEVGSQRTLTVMGTYAVGVSVVVAATAAALIAHQLQRVNAPAPSEIEADDESTDDEVSKEKIEEDIEQAMENVDLNLGGVEKTENKKLSFNTDFGDGVMKGGEAKEPTKTVGSGVDAQVEGLRSMKLGGSKTETSETTVDEQASALNDLKKKKEESDVKIGEDDGSVVSWLLGKVGVN